MPFVVIYLQKASLKAVGLISRNKAMVVAGKDHLRCKIVEDTRGKETAKQESVERQRGKRKNANEK